jgi:hypothetical protein
MEVALCVKAPRRFGKAFAPRRTLLPFRSLDRTDLVAFEAVDDGKTSRRRDKADPAVSFDWLLAFHFLRPN